MKNTNSLSKILLSSINILILIYAISLIYFIFYGKSYQISPCFCSLTITILIKVFYKKFIDLFSLTLVLALIIYILFSSYLGSSFDFYRIINHYDDIMHFLSGVLSVLFGYDIFAILSKDYKGKCYPRILIIVFVFCFSLSIAGLWEIFEFIMDKVFLTNMQAGGLVDTMLDTINCFIASVLTISIYEVTKKKVL